jgi:hypothetical protein
MTKLSQKFLDKVLECAKEDGCIVADESSGQWRLKFNAVTLERIDSDTFRVGLSYQGEEVCSWEQMVCLTKGFGHLRLEGLEGSIPFSVRPA